MPLIDSVTSAGTPPAPVTQTAPAQTVPTADREPRFFYGWFMLGPLMLLSFSSAGARFSFPVFLDPMRNSLGWSVTELSGAAALNLLVAGLLRPVAGILADRYGSRIVALGGLVVAGVALTISSFTTEVWQFVLSYGVLLAVGYACASPVIITTLVSAWFHRHRALALSIGSTGGALGELVTVPLAGILVLSVGWEQSFRAIAAFILLFALPIGFLFIRNHPSDLGLRPLGETARSARGRTLDGRPPLSVREAFRMLDVWRLIFGFFVCGFTMSFASTHFVLFAMEMGFETVHAARVLGMIGAFSIAGSLLTGVLADKLGRKNLLTAVYLCRGISFLVLLQAHHNDVALSAGAFLLGLSWTSTSPLTSSITADRCGLANLGTIFGTMFTIMPIGSAVGAFLAGVLHDLSGSYELSLVISAATGIAAALVVAGVSEPRVPRARPTLG